MKFKIVGKIHNALIIKYNQLSLIEIDAIENNFFCPVCGILDQQKFIRILFMVNYPKPSYDVKCCVNCYQSYVLIEEK